MLESRLKFFRWLVFGIMGLLAIWMIGGNLLASQLEKEINQELEQKAKELAEAYPDPEPNDSALKLEAILVSEFGMVGVVGSTNGQGIFKFGDYIGYHPDFESSNNEFEQIQEQLSQYIDSQISKPNDEIDPPPQALQRYLESKADALEKVQNHVLNSEVPKLETVTYGLLEGDFSMTIQSYLGMANFQKILALDILEKQRQGKNKEAIEMLEVSWRISQSLQNSPSLIGQLVALIVGRFQAGVIRKVDNLSPEWQERLLEHDYRLSVLKTIEGEYFLIYSSIGNLNNYKYRNEVWTDSEEDKVLKFISQIPLSQPYFRFSAINTYHTSRKSLEKLPTQNICQPQDPKLFPNAAWWNLLGQLSVGSLTSQDLKAAKSMLELEFTQKILQVKELAKKQGKWPESMPNLESLFCPDRQYIYQVSEDGTMTISLDQQPEWVKDRDLSLTYSDRTPPQSQN